MTVWEMYVGIDIACATAHVAWQRAEGGSVQQQEIEQSDHGHRQLVESLLTQAQAQHTQVVMEATGNYWMALALALHQAGFVVSVLNPAQARAFAKARLQRTKTDAVDARLLAEFGRVMSPSRWTPPPAICDQLQQLLSRRDDLVLMRTAEKGRLHASNHRPAPLPGLVTSLESHIQWLNAEIDALDQQLRQLLLSNHAWRRAVEHLNTVPSLGPVSIAALMAATHGFVRCQTPEQAAAFAGLAPHTHTSGTSVRGQASIGGGHASLRRILYMCALSAIRYNPVLRDFYQHLLRNGKHKKVALCAVARKLVHIAWAVVVRDRDFDPHFHPAT